MGRLYLTPREFNFISDITKELIKDVVGQKVYYYAINEVKTRTDDLYNEAVKKVFDNPIVLDALVDTHFQTDTKVTQFGVDAQFKIEVYVQWRDLVDKGITPAIGDFFSFSDVFYEVTEKVFMRNIYGMPEHKDGVKLIGIKARDTQFKALTIGPTDISRPDPNAVQTTFYQQRGQAHNKEGETGDIRDLQTPDVLDKPITGAKEVSQKGGEFPNDSAFYDADDPENQ
jgi:hypothetical protein